MPSQLVNVTKFTATSAGTGSFVVSAAVTGYQTPATAGAITATQYSYRAESADLTQWEVGTGVYTSSNVTLPRTPTINSAGGSSAINFTLAPQVGLVALAADLGSGAWTGYTPTVSASSGTFTTTSASGRYMQVGKTVSFNANVTLTAIGTATGQLYVTLPVNALAGREQPCSAGENTVSGVAAQALIANGANTRVQLVKYDATTYIQNGAVFGISGVYEAA